MNDRTIRFILYKKDVTEFIPPELEKQRAVHIVKLPGISGLLSESVDFYRTLISSMKTGDQMYVANARQPLEYLEDLGMIGLKLVSGTRRKTGATPLMGVSF